MLAGAYSKTYQYLEKQRIEQLKQLQTDEVGDAVAKAKKLSVETNKRRKAQATKRKLEQQREEKRRQQILSRRREEQREATEKYQRSHVPSRPPSGRHHSSRKNVPSPSRTLEDTLRLVRGNSSLHRQNSGSSTGSHQSPRQTYTTDALNRPYFNKYSNFHSPVIQNDRARTSSAQDKLHNRSLRNLNNSKSLFEQKLEQQQRQLVDQQKKVFNDFNEAVQKEINHGENEADDSVSLSSADSLEDSMEESQAKSQQQNNYNNNHIQNEQVIHTKSSLQDTHQSVRDISFHLNSAYGQSNGVGYPDRNEKIDSYSVEQTWANSNCPPSSVAVSRPEVQKTQVSEGKDRPKVQLRAWSTPSPIDSHHSSAANSHITNNNPYSSRPSMTAVTSTTAFGDRNSQRSYVQSNGWRDENQFHGMSDRAFEGNVGETGSQNPSSNGYGDTVGMNVRNGNDVTRGYTNGYMYSSENSKSAQPSGNGNRGMDAGASRAMEFLQTVTNTPENADNRVTNSDKEAATAPATESKPSRVPRPVSAVRIQKVQYNVIPPPSSNEETVQAPSGVQTAEKAESGRNGGVQKVEINPKPPQVFINTTSGDQPQVRQVTQVKFAASVVNGGVNMNSYGKMNVQPLPNKPLVIGVSDVKKENPVPVKVTRKAKDDGDLVVRNQTEAEEEVNSGVKGILKRPGSKLKKAGSTGSVNSMDVKDSIEIARIHMHHHHPKQVPRKKSVRFADIQYPSDAEEEPDNGSENSANGHGHSSRPISAKVTSHTPMSQSQAPRAMSAGHRPQVKHKSTIRPQAAAHIITHNNSQASAMLNAQKVADKKVAVVNNNFMSKAPTSLTPAYTEATVYTVPGVKMNYTKSTSGMMPRQEEMNYSGKENNIPMSSGSDVPVQHISMQGAVFDENGLRIDRTPTDEEINFLWEKVRTCLNRPGNQTQNVPISEHQVMVSQPHVEPPRQSAHMAHQYIDGAALNKIVAANRAQQGLNSTVGVPSNTVASKNGDQTYARRYGLLQQRKQQNPNSLNKGSVVSQRQFVSMHNGPVYSNNEPTQNPSYQPPPDVSESMAAFLTAEHLAQHSVSESQIQNAMDQAQRNQQVVVANKPTQKIPTALSIEEQRLLESLDRLNERLKITEFPGSLLQENPQPVVSQPDPQQFVYTGAFKGKQPLNSQRRLTESARGGYRGGVRQQIYRYP